VNSEIPGAANGIYLPPVIMENEIEGVKAELLSILGGTPKWILAGNISHLELLSSIDKKDFKICADFRLNCFNSKSFELLLSAGADSVILSPELTLPQARDIGGSVITMGRIPLMLTERCFIKENFGCERCSHAAIKDRKGARFPIMREREHRNIIFNSSITYMGDKLSELYSVGIDRHHFIFSAESGREILGLIKSYRDGKPIGADVRRIGRR
jgi:putative protease